MNTYRSTLSHVRTLAMVSALLWSTTSGCGQPSTQGGVTTPDPQPEQASAPPYAVDEPLTSPRLFAPNIVSSALPEFATSFAPDGRVVYFNLASADRSVLRIMQSTFADGQWAAPVPVPFSDGTYKDVDPLISPDGARMYFSSNRPIEGTAPRPDFDTWYVERRDDGWGAPINPGAPLNSDGSEVFVSVTRSGTVYFRSDRAGEDNTAFYRAERDGDGYREPERFVLSGDSGPLSHVSNPCVDPDERFLILSSFEPGGLGESDLYVSFRDSSGAWSPVRNLAAANSSRADFAPGISPDGRYLFFTSERPGVVGAVASGRPPGDIYQIELAPLLQQ